MQRSGRVYERAFEGWLIDKRVPYVPMDQARRRLFARSRIKSFDFLLYPHRGGVLLTELKGRRFKGTTLAGLRGLECWVTREDLRGLCQWRRIFGVGGEEVRAAVVFAYRLEHVDVETDGHEVYDFGEARYTFFAVDVDDYGRFMKPRSGRWQTVTLPAAAFRRVAVEAGRYFVGPDAPANRTSGRVLSDYANESGKPDSARDAGGGLC
jgi:hypothetical protein